MKQLARENKGRRWRTWCAVLCVCRRWVSNRVLNFLSTESEARDDNPRCCYNTSSNYFLWRSTAIPLSVKLLLCGFLYRILKDVVMNKIWPDRGPVNFVRPFLIRPGDTGQGLIDKMWSLQSTLQGPQAHNSGSQGGSRPIRQVFFMYASVS